MKRGAKSALGLLCDVTREEQIEKAFDVISDHLGVPYGLFTSAAIDLGGLVHELPAATWRLVLDTNLTGTFLPASMRSGECTKQMCQDPLFAHLRREEVLPWLLVGPERTAQRKAGFHRSYAAWPSTMPGKAFA
jgi:hypothetical protein